MPREKRLTESEWHDLDDLRRNWHKFTDSDPFEGCDTFTERMESRGYARLRPVRRVDLEESFAAERGIESGGNLWELTAKGERAISSSIASAKDD